jgi:hypothetical protein
MTARNAATLLLLPDPLDERAVHRAACGTDRAGYESAHDESPFFDDISADLP